MGTGCRFDVARSTAAPGMVWKMGLALLVTQGDIRVFTPDTTCYISEVPGGIASAAAARAPALQALAPVLSRAIFITGLRGIEPGNTALNLRSAGSNSIILAR